MALTKLDAWKMSMRDEWQHVLHGAKTLLGYALVANQEIDSLETTDPLVKEVAVAAQVWAQAQGLPVMPMEKALSAILDVAKELNPPTPPAMPETPTLPSGANILPVVPPALTAVGISEKLSTISGSATTIFCALLLATTLISACTSTQVTTAVADATTYCKLVNPLIGSTAIAGANLSGNVKAQTTTGVVVAVVNGLCSDLTATTGVTATPVAAPVPGTIVPAVTTSAAPATPTS